MPKGHPMFFWPFLTTVKFKKPKWQRRPPGIRSFRGRSGATKNLERRFLEQEVFGYTIEKVTAATNLEAMCLPERCVMVLT